MNKIKKIMFLIMIITSIICIIGKVYAVNNAVIDTSRKASLTITKYEQQNGSNNNKPLKGVEFTIYEIPSNSGVENLVQAENYIKQHSVTSFTKTTPDSGTITFSNLNLGRYFVVETKAPKNVSTKIESFLIDLPRTSEDGKSWNYDVTVYPKNITIYGSVTLTHTNQQNEPLAGATWKLEKKTSNGDWEQYEGLDILTTNDNGQIIIENLEKGEYRLIQNSVIDGYIMDKTDTKNFTINLENTNKELTAQSEKLEIEKYVKNGQGEFTNTLGAFGTDTLTWKTKADVANIISKMEKYTITEKIPEELVLKQDSIKVYGINGSGNEILLQDNCYSKNITNEQLKIDFNTENLENYKNVVIIYDTEFNREMITYGEYEISASLEYTNCIKENGASSGTYKTAEEKAKVHTGMVKIFKTDINGVALEGAQFKIAVSEENARDGVFIKGIDNQDIVVESNAEGFAQFNGLKFGEDGQNASDAQTEYWIVEVKTPSDKYSLLESPKKVVVNSNSSDNLINIINKEKFTLPLTGGKLNIIFFVLGVSAIVLAIIKFKKKEAKE